MVEISFDASPGQSYTFSELVSIVSSAAARDPLAQATREAAAARSRGYHSLADANAHTHHDLPICLVGGGVGQIKGGRHIRYPKDTPLNNLYLNLLDRAGVPVDNFGDSTGKLAYLSDV